MPTQLTLAAHLEGLRAALVALVRYADRAGPDAAVPTCPGWTVRDLVRHQGAAHRTTAALLRGESGAPPAAPAGDPVEWLRDGAIELVEAITRAPADVRTPVFLPDAPPPREFWARRSCHQTTVHAVDALAAALGRVPHPAETPVPTDLAADGIDELVSGFAAQPGSRLHSAVDAVLLVAPEDVPDWWVVRIGPRGAVAQRGSGRVPEVPAPTWELDGPAVEIYLALANRAPRPMTPDGWPGPPAVGLTSPGQC